MTIALRPATSIACLTLVALLASAAPAQQNRQPTRGTQPPANRTQPRAAAPAAGGDRIAVIDVNHIFKNHRGFKQLADGWKQRVQAAEAQIKSTNSRIEKQVEELRIYKPGDPRFKELEESIAKQRADLQVEVQISKKELMLEEAKMYLSVYEEVKEQVAYFAKQSGITLVLRFNSGEIDPADPRQIQSLMLRPVLYQDHIDITADILSRLNGTAATPPGPRVGERQPQGSRQPQQGRTAPRTRRQ